MSKNVVPTPPNIVSGLKDSLLFTQEWCDLVFEGRNHEYGAYVLRRDAGRRYRRVAAIVGGVFLVFALLTAVVGYLFYRAMQETIAEVQEVVKLQPLRDNEVKMVSAGRRAVAHAQPDAVSETPEVVEEAVSNNAPIGIKGPDDAVTIVEGSMKDHDTYHNADEEDLPPEGVQLTKTQMVEEMPKFPGGITALMRFMDEHCIYSKAAIKCRLEGDLEVSFIIDVEGNVTEVHIEKGLHPTLEAAVIAAVKKMPKWKPGTKFGRPTPVKISIPVHFQVK